MKLLQYLLLGVAGLTLQTTALAATQLNAAGSSFIFPVFSQWSALYHQKTDIRINYQPIGSGGGIRQIIKGTVDFAASDAPLSADKLEKHNLVQFPLIMGGIIPTVHLKGIDANELKLDGKTLAAIFAGKITQWNNSQIAALNPGLTLPDRKITVVHRADSSGTTWVFTHYLSQISDAWAKTTGYAKSINWSTGVGAKGNAGVANYISRIPGAIGYVGLAYVVQNQMTSVKLKNAAGNFVAATPANLASAAAHADWKGTPGYGVILTNQPGANSWPITAATFLLLKQPLDSDKNKVLHQFMNWSWNEGAEKAKALHYVPLPASLVKQVNQDWNQ